MTREEHRRLLSEALDERDAYWKKELSKKEQECKTRVARERSELQKTFAGQLANLLQKMVRQEIQEQIEKRLYITVDAKYDAYSGSDDHTHEVTVDWLEDNSVDDEKFEELI